MNKDNNKEYIYIGPAWTYANYFLHIGHLCAYISGDVLARYYRKKGAEVCLSSGTDSHGTPITIRAKVESKTPDQIAKFYHEAFVEVFQDIDYSFDLYTQTTTDYHKSSVQELVERMFKNGYIYERTAPQAFCPTCNKFIADREVLLTCSQCGKQTKGDSCDCSHVPTPQELIGGVCADCKTKAISKENKHLVLAYSKLLPKLENYINKYSKNWRPNAVGETLKFLKYIKEEGKNADKEITRDISWGVKVPEIFKGYENKRIYVWLEAVLGYYTSCKKWCEDNGKNFDAFFNSDAVKSFYCHGKDNITFHTVLYPCILLACGVKTLPTHIVSTEFFNMGGAKVSKSAGGKLPLVADLIKEIGSDSVRYYFIARGPERKDSEFSEEELTAVHNGEIVNKVGNFINRTLKFKGLTKIPLGKMDADVKKQIEQTYKQVAEEIEGIEFRSALKSAMGLVEYANKYYDDNKPWELAKREDLKDFNNVIYTCCNLAINIANIIEVFMPKCANKIKQYLQTETHEWKCYEVKKEIELNNIEPLFARK